MLTTTENNEIEKNNVSKGGRREIVKGLKRIERLSLHLNKADKDVFDSAFHAERRRKPVSKNTFAIESILKGIKKKSSDVRFSVDQDGVVHKPILDRQTYDSLLIHLNSHKRDVKGISTNLNQLLKKANSLHLSSKAKKEVEEKVNELLPLIEAIVHRTNQFYVELDRMRSGEIA